MEDNKQNVHERTDEQQTKLNELKKRHERKIKRHENKEEQDKGMRDIELFKINQAICLNKYGSGRYILMDRDTQADDNGQNERLPIEYQRTYNRLEIEERRFVSFLLC